MAGPGHANFSDFSDASRIFEDLRGLRCVTKVLFHGVMEPSPTRKRTSQLPDDDGNQAVGNGWGTGARDRQLACRLPRLELCPSLRLRACHAGWPRNRSRSIDVHLKALSAVFFCAASYDSPSHSWTQLPLQKGIGGRIGSNQLRLISKGVHPSTTSVSMSPSIEFTSVPRCKGKQSRSFAMGMVRLQKHQ